LIGWDPWSTPKQYDGRRRQLAFADHGAENATRRNALVAAVRKEFGERAEVCGANAGLHLFVWLKGKSGGMIEDVHGKAERAGVGLYTV
jgi:DNA-binding transcriptional MocR family regulator